MLQTKRITAELAGIYAHTTCCDDVGGEGLPTQYREERRRFRIP